VVALEALGGQYPLGVWVLGGIWEEGDRTNFLSTTEIAGLSINPFQCFDKIFENEGGNVKHRLAE